MLQPPKLMFPQDLRKSICSRYGLLLLAVICALTFALATRFSVQADSHVHGIKSSDNRSAEAKQHLAQDADRFAGIAVTFLSFHPPVLCARVVAIEPLQSSEGLSPSIYTRPPPTAAFSL
jgi:hypothetical protein